MTARVASARVFRRRLTWQLTDDVFDAGCRMLAMAAEHLHGPVATVVAIASGGVPPAEGIAAALRAPTLPVTARHNRTDEAYEQATGGVWVDRVGLADALGRQRLAGNVLLVDDICGSSATLAAVTRALQPHLAADARLVTATLCRNTGAAVPPDLWLWDVSDWVVFPWETAARSGTVALPFPTTARRP